MSSTAEPATPSHNAPWHAPLASHLLRTKTTSFALSTVAQDPQTHTAVPRCRTVEFRGFWPTPALHGNAIEALNAQGIGVNPAVYESDMLAVTTDIRMEKAAQVRGSAGFVEGVFWVPGVGVQWRIRGRAYVTGGGGGGCGLGIDGEEEEEKVARERIRRGMRRTVSDGDADADADADADWDWDRQVTAYFANHSPVMRGSFRNPPPGQLRSQAPEDPRLGLGQTVEDLLDPVARRNFRVVVIAPEEVERLDLTNYEKVSRTRWVLVGEQAGGRWEEFDLWP